jgi:hypothetical protein
MRIHSWHQLCLRLILIDRKLTQLSSEVRRLRELLASSPGHVQQGFQPANNERPLGSQESIPQATTTLDDTIILPEAQTTTNEVEAQSTMSLPHPISTPDHNFYKLGDVCLGLEEVTKLFQV